MDQVAHELQVVVMKKSLYLLLIGLQRTFLPTCLFFLFGWSLTHVLTTDVPVSELLLQTYLPSSLQLFVGGQRPPLVFADSLGLFIR